MKTAIVLLIASIVLCCSVQLSETADLNIHNEYISAFWLDQIEGEQE